MNFRIFFLALGMVASGMNSLLVAGLLPEIARTLDTSEAVVGGSVAALAITYALTGPFVPIVFARISSRTIMVCAMILLLLGLLLSAFAPTVAVFYIARAITGLAVAAYTAQAMSTAMRIAPEGRSGSAAAWVGMGFAVAMALGVPVGTVIGDAFGYRVAFLLPAGIALVTIAGLFGIRTPGRKDDQTLRQRFRPLGLPIVVLVMGAVLLYAVAYFMVLTYLHPILVRGAGIDASLVAVALSVFGVATIASMAVGGRLIDRFGGLPVFIACVLVMSIALPLIGSPIGLWSLIAVAVFGLTGSVVGPASNVELTQLHPLHSATLIGASMAMVQLGAAIGSAIGAAVLVGPGSSWIAYIAGPFSLLAVAVAAAVAVSRRARRSRTLTVLEASP